MKQQNKSPYAALGINETATIMATTRSTTHLLQNPFHNLRHAQYLHPPRGCGYCPRAGLRHAWSSGLSSQNSVQLPLEAFATATSSAALQGTQRPPRARSHVAQGPHVLCVD